VDIVWRIDEIDYIRKENKNHLFVDDALMNFDELSW